MGIGPGEPRIGEWARNGRESPYQAEICHERTWRWAATIAELMTFFFCLSYFGGLLDLKHSNLPIILEMAVNLNSET
jgi:hypothetical protein